MGHFGFSYIGLLILVLLFVPNILWAKRKPEGYTSEGENGILVLLEKVGQALTTTCALIFEDFNLSTWSAWSWWLAGAFGCMELYELWWIQYFRSERKLSDFYGSLFGIPLPGATLPVLAFFLLGIYGKVIWMMVASILLGIGHIGIHWQHKIALGK